MATATRKLGPDDDAEMIRSPNKWPSWPFLPLKKRGYIEDNNDPNMHLGVLVDLTETPTGYVVYHCNLYRMPNKLTMVPRTSYPSIAAMLADGWIVD